MPVPFVHQIDPIIAEVSGVHLLFSLTMPSDWTQDIPARYGKRHAGLQHSLLYPRIEERVP